MTIEKLNFLKKCKLEQVLSSILGQEGFWGLGLSCGFSYKMIVTVKVWVREYGR
jgi:hypothetical protein